METVTDSGFTYGEMVTRNAGFVDAREQALLRDARVLVCGVGGMGGACVLNLVRAGVGRLTIADIDVFEVSNLNRQVFSSIHSVGVAKAEETKAACLRINPELRIDALDAGWTHEANGLVHDATVVVNGTDDLSASLLLYRTARAEGRTVVDAYASPLPSVYVTPAGDPMPEERLGYGTAATAWDAVTDEDRRRAFMREVEYVLVNSSSRRHVDLGVAAEVAAGKRSRMSFAPMVVTAGSLMAYEAIAAILGRETAARSGGWFLDPVAGRVERPRNPLVAAAMRPLVRRFLARMTAGAA